MKKRDHSADLTSTIQKWNTSHQELNIPLIPEYLIIEMETLKLLETKLSIITPNQEPIPLMLVTHLRIIQTS